MSLETRGPEQHTGDNESPYAGAIKRFIQEYYHNSFFRKQFPIDTSGPQTSDIDQVSGRTLKISKITTSPRSHNPSQVNFTCRIGNTEFHITDAAADRIIKESGH